jgi:hypothetical protein
VCSGPGPADSCALRVRELHTALQNMGVKSPMSWSGTHWAHWLCGSTQHNIRTK